MYIIKNIIITYFRHLNQYFNLILLELMHNLHGNLQTLGETMIQKCGWYMLKRFAQMVFYIGGWEYAFVTNP